MRAKRRMTGAEFDAVRELLSMSDKRIDGARLALVDGQTLQGVATIYECTRQAVSDAVSIVWKQHERYQASQRVAASSGVLLPPGWEQVTLIAPSALIARFRAEIAQAMPTFAETSAKAVVPAAGPAKRKAKASAAKNKAAGSKPAAKKPAVKKAK